MDLMKPGIATDVVLDVIRTVDFETLETTFEYENTSGEAIIIDREGVTHHSFTFSELSMMPGDEGFDEKFKEAIDVLRDNIGLLAIWLLNNTSISPL